MKDAIILFGETRCHKTRFYQTALSDRGLDYELAEVDRDINAAMRLTALVGGADKFPTFEINGRKLRNPTLANLDKRLARAGLFDPGLVHEKKSQRFVRYMSPSDAFVSYSWPDKVMQLGHIEIDPSLRGSGLGALVARDVFDILETVEHDVSVTCPFLRRVAAMRRDWTCRGIVPLL